MVLTIGKLSFPLIETPMGPLFSTAGGPYEPIAWLVNQAVTGVVPDLAQALERGEDVYLSQIFARRPEPGENLIQAGQRWRDLTGEELGDDVYLVGVDFLDDEMVVPRAVLSETLARLIELRRLAPKPPSPWLFRPNPIWNEPAPDERELLVELESLAVELDRLESALADRNDLKAAAKVAVKREFLLRDLEACGLLADAFAPVKIRCLREWSLPTLAGYASSADELHRYLRSRERWEILPAAPVEPLLNAPVALDWFRQADHTPAGFVPFRWLAFCERALREAPPVEGYTGQVLTRIAGYWVRIEWRRDNGLTPALVRARQMDNRNS